jgi:hypothetical protein
MAIDHRRKNVKWTLPEGCTWDHVKAAVLMDIRDELQTLNRLLGCPNFTGIPETLRQIRRKIPTRRRRSK